MVRALLVRERGSLARAHQLTPAAPTHRHQPADGDDACTAISSSAHAPSQPAASSSGSAGLRSWVTATRICSGSTRSAASSRARSNAHVARGVNGACSGLDRATPRGRGDALRDLDTGVLKRHVKLKTPTGAHDDPREVLASHREARELALSFALADANSEDYPRRCGGWRWWSSSTGGFRPVTTPGASSGGPSDQSRPSRVGHSRRTAARS